MAIFITRTFNPDDPLEEPARAPTLADFLAHRTSGGATDHPDHVHADLGRLVDASGAIPLTRQLRLAADNGEGTGRPDLGQAVTWIERLDDTAVLHTDFPPNLVDGIWAVFTGEKLSAEFGSWGNIRPEAYRLGQAILHVVLPNSYTALLHRGPGRSALQLHTAWNGDLFFGSRYNRV